MPEFENRAQDHGIESFSDTHNMVNSTFMNGKSTGRELILFILVIILLAFTITFLVLFVNEKDKNGGGDGIAVGNGAARWVFLGETCVGAKNNSYGHLHYRETGSFIGGVKLVHTRGYVGCHANARSNWGCEADHVNVNMIVTDEKNRVIYPPPRLVSKNDEGFYQVPGFYPSSPVLVLSDFGNPAYFERDDELRIWHGEDLLNKYEADNHGQTCMKVYVYKL